MNLFIFNNIQYKGLFQKTAAMNLNIKTFAEH